MLGWRRWEQPGSPPSWEARVFYVDRRDEVRIVWVPATALHRTPPEHEVP